MTQLRVGRSSRAARRPTGEPDDRQHEQSRERLAPVLGVAPLQPCPKVSPGVGSDGGLVSKVNTYPPQLRPIVGIPPVYEKHRPRVRLQVELALQSALRLRLDRVDGDHNSIRVVDGENDGEGVRTVLWMHGRQDAMRRLRQTCCGFVGAQSHTVILADATRSQP